MNEYQIDMELNIDISLDPTLGCGQAHRWKKEDNLWKGVLGNSIVVLEETENGVKFSGIEKSELEKYLRADDDLEKIYSEISSCDPYVASIASKCPGLRLLRQPAWECTATYLLATNANVKRIGAMVESVCKNLGKDLGNEYSFPTPKEILDRQELLTDCKLGYREERIAMLAQRVEDNLFDPEGIRDLSYRDCRNALLEIVGIGPKVADCICLFAYDHMESFPVDARIEKCLDEIYNITGKYDILSSFGIEKFGKNAGYAQELLYHRNIISS